MVDPLSFANPVRQPLPVNFLASAVHDVGADAGHHHADNESEGNKGDEP
jgi:hypothetical protein